nr:hypothetical protein [Tanacetum cinerariifolium]
RDDSDRTSVVDANECTVAFFRAIAQVGAFDDVRRKAARHHGRQVGADDQTAQGCTAFEQATT